MLFVHLTLWVLKSDDATIAPERSGCGVPISICFLHIVTILIIITTPYPQPYAYIIPRHPAAPPPLFSS